MDLLEKQLTKEILQETDCKTALTELRSLFENTFNSDLRPRLQNYTAFKTIFVRDTIISDMNFIKKYMIETILHQQEIQKLSNENKLQKQEDQSNTVQALNVDALKVDLVVIQNTCSEKEDNNSETTFNKPVKESSLNYETKDVPAIKYKISKAKERYMTYFRSLHLHLQFTLDYDSQMTDKYFAKYTGMKVKQFKETLLQHMSNVKKSIDERTRHQRQYDRRVNKRQMQTQESKINTGKALDADLVVTERSATESEVQDENNRSGNDTDTDDADIRPIYDEEPMAEVQLTAECNIFATGQQHTKQPEIITEGRVDQYTEQCQVKIPMLDLSFDNKTTEFSNQSLESENMCLKRIVAQFQKVFSRMEAHCIALELKYQNQALKSRQHG
ncbi:hypothetical protein Tco_0672444 [Tanacetum coccineum]